MPFIETISPDTATGATAEFYRVVEGRVGFVPNWARGFSLRPDVWRNWDTLWASIHANLPRRTWGLTTLAAARALRSSYCSLAHGKGLADKVFDAPTVTTIATDRDHAPLEPRELALMAFAEKVVLAAEQVSQADVDVLRAHGFSDTEIFDIAATAAARCFFSTLLDALGVQPDAAYHGLDGSMREALTVGRPIADGAPE